VNIQRHAIASAVALLAFLVLSLIAGPLGMITLYALGAIALASTVMYFHYRRRSRRAAMTPITPGRDDRVIPQDVKIAVTLRDGGKCQLRFPGICLVDREIQFDHRIAWSNGGSSKDPDNIQLACGPCNRRKSNKVLV